MAWRSLAVAGNALAIARCAAARRGKRVGASATADPLRLVPALAAAVARRAQSGAWRVCIYRAGGSGGDVLAELVDSRFLVDRAVWSGWRARIGLSRPLDAPVVPCLLYTSPSPRD